MSIAMVITVTILTAFVLLLILVTLISMDVKRLEKQDQEWRDAQNEALKVVKKHFEPEEIDPPEQIPFDRDDGKRPD